MNNDKHMYRVYDKQEKEYLPINDYFISPEGLLCFHQGKHRGEFRANRYIKERSLGKRDKNNVLMYENDIVLIKSKITLSDGVLQETEAKGVVRLNASGGYVKVLEFKLFHYGELNGDGCKHRQMKLPAYRSEVIGNVHDNKILI